MGVGQPAPVVVLADASPSMTAAGVGTGAGLLAAALGWLGLRTLNAPDAARSANDETNKRIHALETRVAALEATVSAPTIGLVSVVSQLDGTARQLALAVERLNAQMEAR